MSDSEHDDEILAEGYKSIDVERMEWEHSHDRTPYGNLKALIRELRERGRETSRPTLGSVAYRYVLGYGPKNATQAIEAIRKDLDGEPRRSAVWGKRARKRSPRTTRQSTRCPRPGRPTMRT